MYGSHNYHAFAGDFGGYADFGGELEPELKTDIVTSETATTGSINSNTPATSASSVSGLDTGNSLEGTRSRLSELLTPIVTGRPDFYPDRSTTENILPSRRPDSYETYPVSASSKTIKIDTTTSSTVGQDNPTNTIITKAYEFVTSSTTDLVATLDTAVDLHSESQAQTPQNNFTSNIVGLLNSTIISQSDIPTTELGLPLDQRFTHIIHDIILPIVITIGIFGNLAACLVLLRKIFRSSATARLLLGLTLSAFLHCVLEVPHLLCSIQNLYASENFQVFYRHYLIARNALHPILLSAVTCLTISVTFERYLTLRNPFSPSTYTSVPRASKTILGVYVATALFHLPKCFEYWPNPDLSSAQPVIASEMLRHAAYQLFRQYVITTVTVIIPYVVLFVLLLLLIIAISKFRSQCKKSFIGQSSAADASHMTSAVVAMAITFLLCNSINLYLSSNITIYGEEKMFAYGTNVGLREITEVMIFVYLSLPFILLCAICRDFRSALCCYGFNNTVGLSPDVTEKNSRSNSTFTGIGVSNCSLEFV